MEMDKRKLDVIEHMIKGEKYTEIAKLCHVSRQAIYNWLDDKDFRAEMDRQIQEIRKQGEQRITSKLDTYIGELEKIALNGRGERDKLDALTYLCNRILGNPTNKTQDITDKQEDNNVNQEELTQEFSKFKVIKPDEPKEKAN